MSVLAIVALHRVSPRNCANPPRAAMSESKVATSAEVAAPASEDLPAIAVDFLRRVRHTIDNGDADAKQLFQLADMDNDGALNQRELTSAAACFEVEGVKTPEGAAAMQALFRAAAGGADKIPIGKFISFVQGPAGQSGSTAKPAPDSTAPHAHLHGVEAVHALRYKLRHFVSAGLVRRPVSCDTTGRWFPPDVRVLVGRACMCVCVQVRDYREVFDVLDVDHDGRVTIVRRDKQGASARAGVCSRPACGSLRRTSYARRSLTCS